MRYIGNIISKYKVESFSDFINVTDSIDNVDLSLPTLIIGWEETKSFFPEANILEHNIKDNIFWTFAPRVRRNEFERDLAAFKTTVVKYINKKVKYAYFNVFTASLTDIKKVITYIRKKKSIIFISYNMIYLLYGEKVIGFSFNDAEYLGISREKIMKLLKGNTIVFNNDFLSERDKRTFYGNNIIPPYLYGLRF